MTEATSPLHLAVDNTGGIIDGFCPPIGDHKIMPGVYEAQYRRRWLGKIHNANKMAVIFEIVQPGPFYGRQVARYYNLKRFAKQKGTFHVGWSSAFVREYAACFGMPKQLKTLSMAPFKNEIVSVRVKTVVSDSKQRPLKPDSQYSVIESIEGIAT